MKYSAFILSLFVLLQEGGAFSPVIRQASVVVPTKSSSFHSHHHDGTNNKKKNLWELEMSAVASSSGEEEKEMGTGTAGMASMIFNLVKSVVGVGVLSLPAGTSLINFYFYFLMHEIVTFFMDHSILLECYSI